MARLHDDQRAQHDHPDDDRHRGQPRDRAAAEQDRRGDAHGDHEHADPAVDRPRRAFLDDDPGPGVSDRSRLGLAVLLDVLVHDSSL